MKFCRSRTSPSWLAIGVAIGAGFGAATHDMAMWVGIGAGMGSLLMALSNGREPPQDNTR